MSERNRILKTFFRQKVVQEGILNSPFHTKALSEDEIWFETRNNSKLCHRQTMKTEHPENKRPAGVVLLCEKADALT